MFWKNVEKSERGQIRAENVIWELKKNAAKWDLKSSVCLLYQKDWLDYSV